jgi:ADP-ribose pyrophosphatase
VSRRQPHMSGASGMKNAELLNRRMLLDAPKRFVHESLRMPDGAQVEWFYVDTPGSVMVVPVTEAGNVVFVRQFRRNLDCFTLELPAGLIAPDEPPIAAAVRELSEETGYRPPVDSELIPLGNFYSLPSETNKWTHVFLAERVRPASAPTGDTDIEKYFDMTVEEISFERALAEIGAEIHGMETAGALMLARAHLLRDPRR